ncbi:MAG: multicopper oxidase domain-containing protein [Chloroflexota bacterium]
MHRTRRLAGALLLTLGLVAGAIPPGGPVGTLAPPSAAAAEPVVVRAFDLGFTPAAIEVPTPGTYLFILLNDGAAVHDLVFDDGTTTGAVDPGTASAPISVTVPAGGIGFICSLPGHREGGMHGTVSVAGAAPVATPNAGGDHGGPGAPLPEPDPAAPAYTPVDATAPARLPGDVHDIDLVIEEKRMTVAEGYTMEAWTFGGQVPGPVIRVKVGDTINVDLKNPASSRLSHSVDFHSSQVAWNDEMTSIAPGEEKVYTWTADYAGVWMYHCGTAPALHHIANGMYGMVIVEPADGLPPVDVEYALVQGEWYFDGHGLPASLTKAAEAAPAPDWVVFNGIAKQYADHPLPVPTGGRVRLFVLDAGPSVDSSFHVVGTIFDTVIKEGVALLPGNTGGYGAQAVDLSPAQGAIIELTTAEDGLYPIVTHAFNFVGRGALGLLQAGDGDPLD